MSYTAIPSTYAVTTTLTSFLQAIHYGAGVDERTPWRRTWRRVVFGFPLGLATRPVYQLGRDLRRPAYATIGLAGLVHSPFSKAVRRTRQQRRLDRK